MTKKIFSEVKTTEDARAYLAQLAEEGEELERKIEELEAKGSGVATLEEAEKQIDAGVQLLMTEENLNYTEAFEKALAESEADELRIKAAAERRRQRRTQQLLEAHDRLDEIELGKGVA